MVRGMYRSRTMNRKRLRTPGGVLVTHFSLRKPSISQCGLCGIPLKGVPRARPVDVRKMGKTEKRPSRPYGGTLCSKCSRELIKQKARV